MLESGQETVVKKNMVTLLKRDMKKNWRLYVLLLLPVTYILIFYYWPMYGIQIAFR